MEPRKGDYNQVRKELSVYDCLERVHYRDIHSCVPPPDPVGQQHVRRPAVRAGDQEPDLPSGAQARCRRRVVERVPQVVVA
jgi:hypothetical protein